MKPTVALIKHLEIDYIHIDDEMKETNKRKKDSRKRNCLTDHVIKRTFFSFSFPK